MARQYLRLTLLVAGTGALVAALLLVGSRPGAQSGAPPADAEWRAYGGDARGQRYSPLAQVHRGNVAQLRVAWTAHTGDLSHPKGDQGNVAGCGRCHTGDSKFEATPLAVRGTLFLSTPLNRVLALDPETGRQRWRFDPRLALDISRNEGYVSRGVSYSFSAMAFLTKLSSTRISACCSWSGKVSACCHSAWSE